MTSTFVIISCLRINSYALHTWGKIYRSYHDQTFFGHVLIAGILLVCDVRIAHANVPRNWGFSFSWSL